MTIKNLEEFKRRIGDAYDVEYIVDVLGITSAEILNAFEDKLLETEVFSEMEDRDE